MMRFGLAARYTSRPLDQAALGPGSFALAESINISATADGYRTGAKFYIPAASIPPDDLLKSKTLGRNEPWWFGLLGIRERAQALDARADIVSAPGAGCVVSIRIPFPGEQP